MWFGQKPKQKNTLASNSSFLFKEWYWCQLIFAFLSQGVSMELWLVWNSVFKQGDLKFTEICMHLPSKHVPGFD